MEVCRFLQWDSDFFGKRIGSLPDHRLSPALVRRVNEWCRDQDIDCLYFLAVADDPQTIALAGSNGFRLVDIRVRLELQSAGHAIAPPSFVSLACDGDLEDLAALARVSHGQTRFFSDPGFSKEECEALYETWIRQSCDGYADRVFVARDDRGVAGYISCHRADDAEPARIGLLAVASEAKGRGIGQALVNAALHWFSEEGGGRVSVVTQGSNIAAQRLYQRCGFMTESVGLWYHYWPKGRSRTTKK